MDPDDHTPWFKAVSKFVSIHSPLTCSDSGKPSGEVPGGGGCQGASQERVGDAASVGGGGRDGGRDGGRNGDAGSLPMVRGGNIVALHVMGGRCYY